MSKKVTSVMERGALAYTNGLALGTVLAGAAIVIPGVSIAAAPLVAATAGNSLCFISGTKKPQKEAY